MLRRLFLPVAFLVTACGPSDVEVQEASDPRGPAPSPGADAPSEVQERRDLGAGLILEIRNHGYGRAARVGDVLHVHYRAHVLPAADAPPTGEEEAATDEPAPESSALDPVPAGGEPTDGVAADAIAADGSAEPAPAPGPRLLRSTYAAGVPDRIRLGTDPLIPGLRRALTGLSVGTRVDIRVPAALAYGEAGLAPAVPPGADLLFELELVDLLR